MMKTLIKSLLASVAVLGVLGITQIHALEPVQPKVVAVMFHSDHCGSCKILDPKLSAVKPGFLGQPVLFATLDHTSDGTKNQAAMLAHKIGIGEVYKAQDKASGFMLLVKPGSDEIVGKITRDMSEADIKAAIDQALES